MAETVQESIEGYAARMRAAFPADPADAARQELERVQALLAEIDDRVQIVEAALEDLKKARAANEYGLFLVGEALKTLEAGAAGGEA